MTCDLEVPEYEISSGDRLFFVGDVDDRGADFAKTRAIRGGATLSSCQISIEDTSVITAASATATISGTVATGVFTGAAAGETMVSFIGTMSTGRIVTIQGRFIVKARNSCS